MSNWTDTKREIKEWISKKADEPYLSMLKEELKGCKSVLDVGSGIHSPVTRIPRTFYLEGIDLLPVPKKKFQMHDAYKKGDVRHIRKFYKSKSFDAAVVLDVIEHLTKDDALQLLKDLEVITRKKIIILTPEGYHHQGEVDGNPYMTHLSGWKADEFRKRGYRVHGLQGLKILRGEEAGMKYKPWYAWLLLSHLTQSVTYFFPRIAFHLAAVKSLPGVDKKSKKMR